MAASESVKAVSVPLKGDKHGINSEMVAKGSQCLSVLQNKIFILECL